MDSPAQKRPYYIYILLHHSETVPAGLAELWAHRRGREGSKEKKKRKQEEEEKEEGFKDEGEDSIM